MQCVAQGISATDDTDPAPTLTVTVSCDEETAVGAGNAEPDWEIVENSDGTYDVWLRAERSGKGDGRTYTLTATATDASQNTAIETATVAVRHDKGKRAGKMAQTTPATYSVAQNGPNPFNATTHIHYQLPGASDVSLMIYNLQGQAVRRLVHGSHAAGYYQVMWDGRDELGREVSTGVYLYQFVSRGLVQTKRMLLLK